MEQIPTQPFGTGIVPPPPVPVNPSSRTKFTTGQRKTGFLVKIIGVVIVLGIVSGGAILAARIWDPVWSPFRPSPEKVITAMAEKMKAVKSSHSEVKINIDMKSPSPGKVVISFSGDSDINDPENIKAEGVFGISFTGQLFGTSAETISAKLNIKIIDAEGYVNISELNAPSLTPFLMMMGIDLNNIVGNWIKFPTELLIENQLSQNVDVQAAATEQMQKIISESKIYIVKQQLADKTIEGQKMYHYLVALDNEKTAKLIGDLMTEAMKQSGSDQAEEGIGGALTSGAAKGMISEFLNKIGEINAELLIGKNDNLLYGLKTEKSIDLSKIDSKAGGIYNIILEANNSRFNQPVKVEAPASFKSFEEILPSMPTIPIK